MSQLESRNQPDMSRKKIFELLSSNAKGMGAARLGKIRLLGREPFETPNYTSVTSRGAIPHITPDVFQKHIRTSSAYMALEDFLDKNPPPIYSTPQTHHGSHPLHQFNAFPQSHAIILAPRRCPAIDTPVGNKYNSVSIYTSTGFFDLTVPQYTAAVQSLRPDVVIPLADVQYNNNTPVDKKLARMVERTEEWLDHLVEKLSCEKEEKSYISVFAPILPAEHSLQWAYYRHLAEDLSDSLEGLAIYDINVLPDVGTYASLDPLPKLSLHQPSTPQEILRQVSLGIDICTLPFINSVSDAGIALDFTFPPPPQTSSSTGASSPPLLLGYDMWPVAQHQTSLAPLVETCQCYACTSHHRAFVNHLLNAKEMLGWNLLQIHNHHVVSEFFAGIRQTLKNGTEAFEEARAAFSRAYDCDFPKGTGERPRARGHHFKSDGALDKINKPAWRNLNAD